MNSSIEPTQILWLSFFSFSFILSFFSFILCGWIIRPEHPRSECIDLPLPVVSFSQILIPLHRRAYNFYNQNSANFSARTSYREKVFVCFEKTNRFFSLPKRDRRWFRTTVLAASKDKRVLAFGHPYTGSAICKVNRYARKRSCASLAWQWNVTTQTRPAVLRVSNIRTRAFNSASYSLCIHIVFYSHLRFWSDKQLAGKEDNF